MKLAEKYALSLMLTLAAPEAMAQAASTQTYDLWKYTLYGFAFALNLAYAAWQFLGIQKKNTEELSREQEGEIRRAVFGTVIWTSITGVVLLSLLLTPTD